MDVNVASMFLTCRAVVPRMRERGGGRIVNISSGTPFRGVPFLLHYVTSKGAIVAFTRALAKELGGDEILVNCVAPGLHDERRASRSIPRSSRRCATSRSPRARSSATRCPRTSSARSSFLCGPASTSSPGRRWSSTAASTSIETRALHHPGGVDAGGPNTGSSIDARGRRGARALGCWTGRAALDAGAPRTARCSSAEVDLGDGPWLLRCDRIDFEPGGVAYRHTHPGPGIRCLLFGAITIDCRGRREHAYGPGEPWFERGPDPVLATTTDGRAVRVRPGHAAAGRVGGQAHDPLRRSRRRGEAEDPARDGLLRAAGRARDAAAAGRSSSTSSSCTAPTSRSACPARATSPVLDALHDAPVRLVVRRHEAAAANMADAYGKLTGRPGRLPRHARARRDARVRRRAHRVARTRRRCSCSSGRSPATPRAARASRSSTTARCSARWRSGRRRSTTPRGCPSWSPGRSRSATSGRPGPGRARAARGRARRPRPTCPTRRPRRPLAAVAPGERRCERLARAARRRRAPAGRRRRGRLDAHARGRTCSRSPRRARPGRRVVPLPGLRRQPLADVYAGHAALGHGPGARASGSARPTCCSRSAGGSARSASDGYTLLRLPGVPRQRLVHVHPDPGELGTVYQPELAIVCGLEAFAAAGGGARAGGADARERCWPRRPARDYERNLRDGRELPGELQMSAVMADAARAAAPPTRSSPTAPATSRSGRTASTSSAATARSSPRAAARWATASRPRSPRRRSHPDRAVVCLAGDGDFLMTGQELATAVQEGLPIVVLVVNNGMYGTIRMHQERHYPGRVVGDRPASTRTSPRTRAAFGAHGARRRALRGRRRRVRTRRSPAARPAVLDLRVDPRGDHAARDADAIRAAATG